MSGQVAGKLKLWIYLEKPMVLKPNVSRKSSSGFALVVTLTLMVLLSLLALGLLSLSAVTLRNSSNEQALARANARAALTLALGELQKAAGPDQRITATASILGESENAYTSGVSAQDGYRHWVGVWKSDTIAESGSAPSFNPMQPDTREFVGWLVSSEDPSASQLSDVSAASGGDDIVIFNGADDASTVRVPKVAVENGSGGKQFYAYWVEDQGVKANMGWSEGVFPDEEREQAARLSVAPGPDYGVFEGPFDGNVSYPVSSSSGNIWLDKMRKAFEPADVILAIDASSNQSDWLRKNRHDITLGSYGVMSDVKWGGLRRDLSLAFEMDGTADMPTTMPAKFNSQIGEFVGNGDRLSAPKKPNGLPVNERFLYRDFQGSGTLFADSINRSEAVMRGPNWWALRDYANLYKRLKGSAGNYTLTSRPYYPNRSTEGNPFSAMLDTAGTWGDQWDREEREGWFSPNTPHYLYRPAQPAYGPVNLGTTALVSVLLKDYDPGTQRAKLAIGVDPIFYLWNPYNRQIEVTDLKVSLANSFPGTVRLEINEGATTRSLQCLMRDIFQWNINSNGREYSFNVKTPAGSNLITMEPGEVIVVSPSTAGSETSTTGYFTDGVNDSGLIMTEIEGNNKTTYVNFASGNPTIGYVYTEEDNASSDRFYIETEFPNPATPTQMDESQHMHMQLTAQGGKMTEYVSPQAKMTAVFSPPLDAAGLVDQKHFFGLFTLLMKPAFFGGENPNPVEVFSRFNPAPMVISKDFWRANTLNQVYNHVTDSQPNNLLNGHGINFSSTDRNGFWGASFQSGNGSTSVPMSNIPSAPLMSLAELSHAHLSTMASEPYHAVGNSWSSAIFSPVSPYGRVITGVGGAKGSFTAVDQSWLLNDALFDRYYFSGLAPEFSINGSGYNASGTLEETISSLFGDNPEEARANPVLHPFLPRGVEAADVIADLSADDGYRKLGAYALIDGVFNVNSTSVAAWEAFLSANRDLAVTFADGSVDSASGTPFPSSVSPSPEVSQPHWGGFSRMTENEISDLAVELVEQIKLRGPFMSISDFVNHRVGTPKTNANYTGAIQAALDEIGVNDSVQSSAGGVTPQYPNAYVPDVNITGLTTAGIAGDITQADVLRAIAPRLSARSDTFRIRAYGEVRSKDGTRIIAQATCEALVQRFPEYMDATTDPNNNEAWDETTDPINPSTSNLNEANQRFGRRFEVVGFRWLHTDEI